MAEPLAKKTGTQWLMEVSCMLLSFMATLSVGYLYFSKGLTELVVTGVVSVLAMLGILFWSKRPSYPKNQLAQASLFGFFFATLWGVFMLGLTLCFVFVWVMLIGSGAVKF